MVSSKTNSRNCDVILAVIVASDDGLSDWEQSYKRRMTLRATVLTAHIALRTSVPNKYIKGNCSVRRKGKSGVNFEK